MAGRTRKKEMEECMEEGRKKWEGVKRREGWGRQGE